MSEENKPMSASDMRLLSDAEQIISVANETMGKVSVDDLSKMLSYIEGRLHDMEKEDSVVVMPKTVIKPLVRMAGAWVAHSIIQNLEERGESDADD